jgi:GNAT superfamily N-acetyltransferase
VTVRPLRADETPLFKTLRLRALADSPHAFAHTYAEISAKPEAWWEEMTRSVTEPGRHAMFVAERDAEPVGMAFGIVDRERPATAHLGGMWVDPVARGDGVGRALADAVLDWARGRGFVHVVLWVTDGNAPAIALYERLGFVGSGRREPAPTNPGLDVLEMERAL